MYKRVCIFLLFISYILIIGTGCTKQNNNNTKEKKQYNLILLQEKFHHVRYDIGDVDDELILNEDAGEVLSKNLYIVTNDSIYVGLNVSDQYTGFTLYSIEKINDLSLLLKSDYNTEKDSLLLKLDEENKILEINENKYYINKSYVNYLKKAGFHNKSILPFVDFINPNLDDFYSFHNLVAYRWMKRTSVEDYKILKSDIKVVHPLNDDIIFDFSVDYIYKGDNLLEIFKYDEDRDTLYHKKYVSSIEDYELYEYNYNDILGRSYEEGNIYQNKNNMEDSISSDVTSVQRGQIDESRSKIIFYKEYPINKLNLSKTEIESLISKDLILPKEN